MSHATPGHAVQAALEEAHRAEWARVLAATARVTRDLGLAEECTQDAYAQALRTWPDTGVPTRPGAWLTTVAANRARDVLRREATLRRALPRLVASERDPEPSVVDGSHIGDDRLRLVFICCHPALAVEAQIALTLRLVCGLSTSDVARAFLVQESTMAARITRAKKKIAAARIPYRVPSPDDLPERIAAVASVIHLVFTTGHAAPHGDRLVRQDLVDSAIRMARMLHQLLPGDADITALLALMLLTDSRRGARMSGDGDLLRLSEQDRTTWDAAQITEGVDLVREVLAVHPPGRYAVEAAIAAVHAEAPSWEATDWAEIVGLYDVLLELWPSPVVRLNRAAAIGYRYGPGDGLAALEPLLHDPALSRYPYLSATRADLLARSGEWAAAEAAYEDAITLTSNEVERDFLVARLAETRGHIPA
jgi:RNA polymerase sigma-70 factor (ECF subfamily)